MILRYHPMNAAEQGGDAGPGGSGGAAPAGGTGGEGGGGAGGEGGGGGSSGAGSEAAKASAAAAAAAKAAQTAGASANELQTLIADMRKEREALAQERQANTDWREGQIAAQRRAEVRGYGLAVDLSDAELDALIPKVNPSTAEGRTALTKWREEKTASGLFKGPAAPPSADPEQVVTAVTERVKTSSRLVRPGVVRNALTVIHAGRSRIH